MSAQEKPIPQSMLALIAVRIMGNNIGKPKMAVRVELLFVLAAMAATKVKIPEIPKLPKINTRKNTPLFSMGLPSNTVKNNQLIKAMANNSKLLNINLDRIIDCGLHKL